MKYLSSVTFLTSVLVTLPLATVALCGCKSTRKCYENMVAELKESNEVECIEDSATGTATVTVFLMALNKYCTHVVQVKNYRLTYEGRALYEVVINGSRWGNESKAVIFLDGGQDGGVETVKFSLYLISQLVSCMENSDMIKNFRWVILPSSNPDGLEYTRMGREQWRKNMVLNEDGSFGVDITKNFDHAWSSCPINQNTYSQDYAGQKPISEIESKFVTNILNKYKGDINAYLTLRRDGHAILYPYASINTSSETLEKTMKMAGDIAAKVNIKGSGVSWFLNDSIINMNGKPWCGHSVDYVFDTMSVAYAYEMRIFMKSDIDILSERQPLPKGYETTLQTSYLNGIKELYKALLNERKQLRRYFSLL